MKKNINRRDLFKFTGGAAVGLALAGTRVSSGLAAEPDERPDGIISLSGNENSYGPSPAARASINEVQGRANRYGYAQQVEFFNKIDEK